MIDRIHELQNKAVYWALQPDGIEKTMFAFWLHGELEHLYNLGVKEKDKVDFNALVKILLEHILPVDMGDETPRNFI